MELTKANVLVTGAGGGIGSAIARVILEAGGRVLLTDANEPALAAVHNELAGEFGNRARKQACNLTSGDERSTLVAVARQAFGGINVLVNCAGVSHFGLFSGQHDAQVERAMAVNVTAPILLTRALLPDLLRKPYAQILNIGSVFGTIGYPGYAVYSATKFAIRGFSEALRRELADTPLRVHYLAPRATRTGINGSTVEAMNDELGVAMDDPRTVAVAARRMLSAEQPEAVVGWPEKLFARLNAALPRVVDIALRRQLPTVRRYAQQQAQAPQTSPPVAVSPPG